MGITVTLEWYEVFFAAYVGSRRHIEAMRCRRKDAHGLDHSSGWNLHIEGVGGELAYAKSMNVFYSASVNTFKLPDVGTVQIRTRTNTTWDLIVRADDPDDDTYVLVVGTIPTFTVVGSITGRDAKRPEWIKEYGGRPAAYFVPQNALSAIGDKP